jgi:hypothetical protein
MSGHRISVNDRTQRYQRTLEQYRNIKQLSRMRAVWISKAAKSNYAKFSDIHLDEEPTEGLLWFEDLERAAQDGLQTFKGGRYCSESQ